MGVILYITVITSHAFLQTAVFSSGDKDLNFMDFGGGGDGLNMNSGEMNWRCMHDSCQSVTKQ